MKKSMTLEQIGAVSGTASEGDGREERARLVYLRTDKLFPHPDNPRKDLGDLTEMAESIKANGVMQNLTVVENIRTTEEYERMLDGDERYSAAYRNHAAGHAFDGGYTVVIGHRRLAAAKLAGFDELPCVVVPMTYREQIATMMTENVQRADLTVYEQAQGFRQMSMDLGMSVDTIAKQTGFSATTVRRRLKLCELDQKTLKEVSGRQISMADLERLDKIDDRELRNKALKEIGTANFNRECVAAMDEQERRKKREKWRTVCLEAGLTEIKEKEAEDSKKYTRVAYCYGDDRSGAAIEKYLADDRELCFYVNRWGYLILVTPRGQANGQTKAADERDRREQERVSRTAALKDAFDRAYRLRYDFIDRFTEAAARAMLPTVVCMAAHGCVEVDNFDRETFYKLMGGTDEQWARIEEGELDQGESQRDSIKRSPCYAALALAYASFYDRGSENFYDYYGRYRSNTILKDLYGYLCELGYEMSDEEKSLTDGTHGLFERAES